MANDADAIFKLNKEDPGNSDIDTDAVSSASDGETE